MKFPIRRYLIIIITLCSYCATLKAQQDTSYYSVYNNKLTARFYFSRKFTSLNMKNKIYNVNYRPNTTLNMGIGATYKGFTLNLAYGFPFLNPDNGQGKTRYLDLQFHNYGRKIIFDMFGQFYSGFFLSPRGAAMGGSDKYYIRPDLRVNMIGTSIQYVFNSKRFSYRAAYLQNEWQKKSAGTFLVGMEGFFGWIKSDSTLTPTAFNKDVAALNYKGFQFSDIGLNGGYAYTFVIKKNYFVTGSALISLDVETGTLKNDDRISNKVSVSPNTLFRVATGYNSANWAICLFYVNSSVRVDAEDRVVAINTSNVRLNFVRRIKLNKKTRKYLKPIENLQSN